MKTIQVFKWLCQNVFIGVVKTTSVVTVPAKIVGNTLLLTVYYSILGI